MSHSKGDRSTKLSFAFPMQHRTVRRPPKRETIADPYSFEKFEREDGGPPLITACFQISKNVIFAYKMVFEIWDNFKYYIYNFIL